jgi:hypothetical protein
VTNLTIGIDKKNPGVIIKTTVTLGYDNPWRKIHETLCQAALRGCIPVRTEHKYSKGVND